MAPDKAKSDVRKICLCYLYTVELLFLGICHVSQTEAVDTRYVFKTTDIHEITDNSCFVGFSIHQKSNLESVFVGVESAFNQDDNVLIGFTDLHSGGKQSEKHNGDEISHGRSTEYSEITVFKKRSQDRTCLSTGVLRKPGPISVVYSGSLFVETVVDFINEQCNTYRTSKGHLTIEGIHREEILRSLFQVQHVSDINLGTLYKDATFPHCTSDSCSNQINESINSYSSDSNSFQEKGKRKLYSKDLKMHKCDKIPLPSKQEFFHNYLKVSKPVIFTGAINSWPAMTKWSNRFLREKYGQEKVHIKLTPYGEYEGVDTADQFENFDSFSIPPDVKNQLLFPDLVVVRPGTADMKLSQFLDIIEEVSNGTRKDFSAYLEYSSLAAIVPELEDDVEEMPFFERLLELKHLNIWLSDGNTLGKIHFDPFDNFLCQISGRKEVILFDPNDNTKLYEAHIPEAMLEYNSTTKKFHKKTLVDSTSMVMSPVDISKPDFKRFPRLADAYPMNCTIDEGEVLFMPAFWWHEVQSYPNLQQGRNLAVNFWYDPFLVKEFPCQECKLDINPKYRHLL